MKLVLHIIRKDFRHLRFIFGTWCALVILTGAWNAHWGRLKENPEYSHHFWSLVLQVAMVELLLRAAVVSKLIHSDSAVGSTAFWLSRPIPKTNLLASKAIFLAVLVVLPVAIVESEFGTLLSDTPPQFLEVLLSSMAYISVFTLMAALTRNLVGMATLAAIVFGAIWLFFSGLILLNRWYSEHGRTGWDLSGEWLLLFLVVACGAVTWHQYLTRRTGRSRVLAFFGIPIVILVLSGPWF